MGPVLRPLSAGSLSNSSPTFLLLRPTFRPPAVLARMPKTVRVIGRSDCAAHQLADSKNGEARHGVGIAARQTPRLRAETKQPLESVSLHPQRGLTFRACQEVERGPDADHDRCLNAPEVVRHPELLLWRAQPHPYDVGARRLDRGNHGSILLGR